MFVYELPAPVCVWKWSIEFKRLFRYETQRTNFPLSFCRISVCMCVFAICLTYDGRLTSAKGRLTYDLLREYVKIFQMTRKVVFIVSVRLCDRLGSDGFLGYIC